MDTRGGRDDDDDGICHRKRRCHGSGGDDASGSDSGDGSGDWMEDDDNYDYYDDCIGGEVDDTCDDDVDSDDEYAVEDDEETTAVTKQQPYNVLTEDMILARQQKDTVTVAEILSIPAGYAAALLRHFKWRPSQVEDAWFSDDRRVRDAVGLPPPGPGVAISTMALSTRRLRCGICFVRFNAGRTRSAGCLAHYYCDACWVGYVGAAVADGARCLSLRCPEPGCSAAVVEELVNAVAADAGGEVRARYARFALRSYVEQSGGAVRWCPGAGCARAVELLDGGDGDVFCECARGGFGFCWRCGEEAHRPVSCGTVRAWLAKNVSDSESANWVLTHTKHCPSCRRPIEKNHGCNHMTCRAPCGHQFCWLCFQPWKGHRHCKRFEDGYYSSDPARQRQDDVGKEKEEEKRRRRQAKASLDRYLYYYERWEGNGRSLQKALADMDELQQSSSASGMERMAASLEIAVEDLAFLTTAYEAIADGRRVMRWVYAYGYFLDPDRDRAKRNLLEHLQDDANRMLEDLHHSAEVERAKFVCGAGGHAGSAMNETYRAYKDRLVLLTKVTRNYFGNLARAFENELSEIDSVTKKR